MCVCVRWCVWVCRPLRACLSLWLSPPPLPPPPTYTQVYSFAIRQLLTSESAGMRKTLKELTYDPISGKPDFARVKQLVREAAAIAGSPSLRPHTLA